MVKLCSLELCFRFWFRVRVWAGFSVYGLRFGFRLRGRDLKGLEFLAGVYDIGLWL